MTKKAETDYTIKVNGMPNYANIPKAVLEPIFRLTVRMSAQDKLIGFFFGQFVDIYVDKLFVARHFEYF